MAGSFRLAGALGFVVTAVARASSKSKHSNWHDRSERNAFSQQPKITHDCNSFLGEKREHVASNVRRLSALDHRHGYCLRVRPRNDAASEPVALIDVENRVAGPGDFKRNHRVVLVVVVVKRVTADRELVTGDGHLNAAAFTRVVGPVQ